MTPADVRALRERLGLTPAQFARLLGVHPSTVSRWESGRRYPTGGAIPAMRRLQRRQEGAR